MREVHRYPGAARHVDHLGVGVQRALAIAAIVGAEEAAERRHLLAQRHQFLRVREHGGRVGQPGGETDRALRHALPDVPPHLRQLSRGGRAILTSQNQQAHGAVGNSVVDVG